MMKFIFILFLLPLQLFSQDLSGIWVGTIATSETKMPLELVINQDMSGYSMITFEYKGVEKVAVKRMTMIQKDSVYNISDDKMIFNNFAIRSRNIKTFCDLSLTTVGEVMVLSGPFHTRTRDLRAGDQDLSSGTITLQKQSNKAQTKLIGKLDSLKLSNTISFSNPEPIAKENPVAATAPKKDATSEKVQSTAVSGTEAPLVAEVPDKDIASVKVQQTIISGKGKNNTSGYAPSTISGPANPVEQKIIVAAAADIALRKTEIIRSIDFKSDSLTLVLYDNGTVDGDTVSVVLNDEVIIPKQGLSERAYRKVIRIPPELGDSLKLVMYAENLGSIPPNTGLLIVEDGSDRQEIRFEGDLKKSSAVILRRKR
ncbi:MAG TPA: hypothetical protein VKT28_11995 [Puia sp.]|nr:hypothetical protein [Puia sp.]